VVGRPLLVVFWVLVLWGTLYDVVLLRAAFVEGPIRALQRTVSGRDIAAGLVNLGLAALAPVVWALVGLAVWRSRSLPSRRHHTHVQSE
jgi:hypothetical protein